MTEYSDIIKDIYTDNIESAVSKIIDILTNGKENKFEEELLAICVNISSSIRNTSLYISLKKLQAELYIQKRKIQEAATVIDELEKVCLYDEDVIGLKKCLEN